MRVHLQQFYVQSGVCVHDMYIRTVPRIAVRQIGQSRTVGAQVPQHTMWLQGKNNVEISLSMQTLHSIVSFSRRFSSFRLSTSAQAAYEIFNNINYKHRTRKSTREIANLCQTTILNFNHMTIRFAIGHLLLVVVWNQAAMSNGFREICIQIYLGHKLDLWGSHVIIVHLTIWYTRCNLL